MKSMTIGAKLLLSFGAVIALALAVGAVSLSGFGSLGNTTDALIKVNARRLYLAGEVNTVTSDLQAAERGIMARFFLNDHATMEKYNQDVRESTTRLTKRLDEYLTLAATDEDRRTLNDLKTAAERIASGHGEFYRHINTPGQTDAAQAFYKNTLMPLLNQTSSGADNFTQQENRQMASIGEAVQASVARSRWSTILMLVMALAVGGVVLFVVTQINRSLRQTAAELNEGAAQTASAASQVSSSSQSLAQGASEQAASLQETSASSEEISSMAHKNSQSSRMAADFVMQAHQKFGETDQSLEQMIAAMGEIGESSGKISKIIRTIDEIAFQTNILALNAAVEAARAGEAGMGFAVVADEVRSLAQRCAQAAKDTAELIEDSIAKSTGGKTKVDQVAIAVREIAELASKVKTLVDEVNLGSEEQAKGIEQIGKAISQMEQVTQKTAAGAEESASAAEELTAQSETLKEIVSRLTLMVDGRQNPGRQSAAATRIPATAARPSLAATPKRHPDSSSSSLRALGKAVAPKTARPTTQPALAAARIDKHAIPMDGDFEEF